MNCSDKPGVISTIVETMTARRNRALWVVFLFALAVGLLHHRQMKASDPMYGYLAPGGDNYNYHVWAGEIAQMFWLEPQRLPFEQGPLYPYFLALVYLRFGLDFEYAVLAQVFVGACSVALVFLIARRAFGVVVALLASLGAACCPLLLLYQGELLPDSLIVFVNLVFLYMVLGALDKADARRWGLVGSALGVCAVARSNALLLAILPIVLIWRLRGGWKRRAALLGAFVAGILLPIAPITLLNYTIGGEFALLTKNPLWNLYIGNAPDASGTYARPPTMWYIIALSGKHESEITWGPVFLHFLREDPTFIPRNLLKKSLLFWQSGELPHVVNFYLKRQWSPFLRVPLAFGTVAPFGLVGMALVIWNHRRGRASREGLVLTAFVFLYSISIIIVFVIARFRLPALAVLMILAAYAVQEIGRGLVEALRATGKDRLKCATKPVTLLLAALALTAALRTRNPDRLIRWSDYYNLAGAYQEQDKFEEALDAYERALELNPDASSARAGKAAMESRLGRTPGEGEGQSSSMLSAPDGHRATTSRMADSEAAFTSATI